MPFIPLLVAITLLAQPEPASNDADALKGPQIPICKAKSLVERDFQGTLRRLEIPVEEAALELIPLSETERIAAQAVLDERSVAMTRIVGENLELLLQFKLARDSNNTDDTRRLLREFYSKLAPVRQNGTMHDQLAAVLSAEHALELKRLSTEYRDAVIEDLSARQGPDAKRPRIALTAALAELGVEIKRAYESSIEGGQQELDALVSKLALDDTQEASVRAIVSEYFQTTMGKPNAAQRIKLFQDVNKILTPDQQAAFLREIYANPADRKPSKDK